MITVNENLFLLETAHTGYYLAVRDGLVENLHYGARIHISHAGAGDADLGGTGAGGAGTGAGGAGMDVGGTGAGGTGTSNTDACAQSLEALRQKADISYGSDVIRHAEDKTLSLDHICLELSPLQKGDYRAQSLSFTAWDESTQRPGGGTVDFSFVCARKLEGSVPPADMPGAFGGAETLALDFTSPQNIGVTLYYTVYPECDVITRRLCVQNNAAGPVTLQKAMSYQLDLPGSGYVLSTLNGAWGRERHVAETPLAAGAHTFGSTTGASSAFCNPFFFLSAPDATEFSGEVYGFNLVYSGSHAACAGVSPWGKTRVMAGIQPEGFAWTLAPGESFETPEAVLTFSRAGKNGMSENMHAFVREHIVRGSWAKKDRPVLLNNWEGTYFDFNERKLLSLAKDAARLGAELFVLDDGWFGARSDDTKGLGDYTVNRKKLPGGLAGLAEKVHSMGLLFGLWFEPEMVNKDSDLYRAHPDWIVRTPGTEPGVGRNQYVLDLCRTEVQDYIIKNVNATLASARIDYVKWDMNRNQSDQYSPALAEQGRFSHSYILGLYRVFREITEQNPEVLFEGCASGGNRFDLGVLCYMPQIWTSDDTDAYERQLIQAGTSYGYPPSVMGCHVSAAPNHQTARTSPIESRFNVAAFGVLGYELDLAQLTPAEQKAVAAQIAYYKQHRRLFQYGRFVRLCPPQGQNKCEWMAVSPDGSEALVGEYLHLLVPNSEKPPLRLAMLCPDALYEMESRSQVVDIRTFGGLLNHVLPVKMNTGGHLIHAVADHYMMPCETERYTAYGDLLMYAGVKQKQAFTGTGYNENVRLMPDFSSRVYYLRRVEARTDAAKKEDGAKGY